MNTTAIPAYVHVDQDDYAAKIAAEEQYIRQYDGIYPKEVERARARIAYYQKRMAEQNRSE
jgi:hypothetical protein